MVMFFEPRVLKGEPDVEIQGTDFVACKPVAGFINGEFVRGDLVDAAHTKLWMQGHFHPAAVELTDDPHSGQASGMKGVYHDE